MALRRTEPLDSAIVLSAASCWFISLALPFILSVFLASHIEPQ